MSLMRIFGLMLLFLFFEAVVAVSTVLWGHQANVLLVCGSMTGIAVAVWLTILLVTRLLNRQRAAQPVDAPKPAATMRKAEATEDAFTQEFKALLQEANGRLAGLVPMQDGKPASLQSMPLYLLIGPESSGKTSALLNSGLEPRLLAGEASREANVLPTKLANIWLLERSIFVEISGRVLTQDPDHWQQALRILVERDRLPFWKRLLSGTPPAIAVRGVLLACDTQSFVRQSELQRLPSVARMLNERLQAVEAALQKEFPVYVLFTRADGLQYFNEFFAHLSETEARRPVGTTLEIGKPTREAADAYSDREARRLTDLFNRLYQSLADKRTMLLSREEDAGKRALAYEFPRELKKIRGDVVQFLLDVFRPATLAPRYRLRGFYFCGRRMVPRGRVDVDLTFTANSVVRRPSEATVFFETKQAASADQSVFAKRAGSGSTVPRWAFLVELFRDIVLVDPAGDMVAAVRGPEHRIREWSFAAAGALCLVLTIVWANAWRGNHDLLESVQAAVQPVRYGPASSQVEAMAQLESMRPVLQRLHADARNGAPLSYRWGLYSGEPAKDALDQLYFQRLRQAMLDPVLAEMAARLLALQPNTPAGQDVTALVKAYRSMTSRACAPDEAVLSATVLPLWRPGDYSGPEVASLGSRQFGFYTAELKIADPYAALGEPLHENHEAIYRAQNYLQGMNGPEKILGALVSQIDGQQTSEKLSTYAGDYAQVMSGPNELEAAYTARGWVGVQDALRSHKLLASGEPCVVGSSGGVTTWEADDATQARLNHLYEDAYTQQWKQFLAAHHVLPFSGTADASQKLRVLADNNRSPLLALVYMTSSNTNVADPKTVGDRMSDTIRSTAQETKNSIGTFVNKFGNKNDPAAQAPAVGLPAQPPDTVMSEFAPVHAMVNPAVRETWLNEKNQAYVKGLEELSTALAVLPPRVDTSSQTDTQALAQANAAVANATMALHTLEGSFPNTPSGVDVELKALLQEPITYAGRVVHEVVLVKPAPIPAAGSALVAAAPPPGPSPHEMAKHTIEQINHTSHDLCTAVNALETKYPFDATATQDATLDEMDQVFGAGNGALDRFSATPDVSKAYTHQGKTWTPKPEFPATFSQPFLFELNNLSQFDDALYGEGGSHAHFEYTVTLDGTGKIPFELDVDGHNIKYVPGKPGIPTRLVWPPLTNSPTRLIAKTGAKGGLTLPAQNAGAWSLHHLLQAADDQNGNVFTFRTVGFAHSLVPLTNEKGTPGTLQIRVDSPAGSIFSRGYFAKLRCESNWAVN